MIDIGDILGSLEESEFEERPVDIDTFISSGYLELDRNTNYALSDYQKEIIKRSTQIYDYQTLVNLYGEKQAKKEYKYTESEVIAMLGKGAGKDAMSEISCAYVVYKLLCLKDPAGYYGKPPGDAIDLINIATNADQAKRVFFKGFKNLIKNSPWFQGKYHATANAVEFDKSVNVYSGHSEMESFEGYNLLFCVLDEISGFSGPAGGLGEDGQDDPAQAIYDMFEASVTSRFPDHGKLILLSFPRHSKDFITKRYNEVIAEKHSVQRSHEYILNEEISPTAPGNQLTVSWTEDTVIRYKEDRVWALRRPCWEVNPTKHIDNYKRSFLRNYHLALGKFAAEPSDGADGFFNDHERVESFAELTNGISDEGTFYSWFTPKEDAEYFIHVDLARKHDRAVVSMARVIDWKRHTYGGGMSEILPTVHVELMRYWTPTKTRQVDFGEIREFVMGLARRGFNIRKVTFDQWQSDEMMNYFNNAGLRSEKLSVGLQHYNDLKLMINEGRVRAPTSDLLVTELKQLQITKNGKNVDHPTSGSKDLADSVCGAAYLAATLSERPDWDADLDVVTLDDYRKADSEAQRRDNSNDWLRYPGDDKMPKDVETFFKLIGQ